MREDAINHTILEGNTTIPGIGQSTHLGCMRLQLQQIERKLDKDAFSMPLQRTQARNARCKRQRQRRSNLKHQQTAKIVQETRTERDVRYEDRQEVEATIHEGRRGDALETLDMVFAHQDSIFVGVLDRIRGTNISAAQLEEGDTLIVRHNEHPNYLRGYGKHTIYLSMGKSEGVRSERDVLMWSRSQEDAKRAREDYRRREIREKREQIWDARERGGDVDWTVAWSNYLRELPLDDPLRLDAEIETMQRVVTKEQRTMLNRAVWPRMEELLGIQMEDEVKEEERLRRKREFQQQKDRIERLDAEAEKAMADEIDWTGF